MPNASAGLVHEGEHVERLHKLNYASDLIRGALDAYGANHYYIASNMVRSTLL